jgi:thiol-disulfide isomerase/thioredoxin
LFALAVACLLAPSLAGPWRAVLDLSGGTLKFGIELTGTGATLGGKLCNGEQCDAFSAVRVDDDSVRFELADYAASITAAVRGDSLIGVYRNVGNRGPRLIPFRAARGRWLVSPAPAWLAGRWYAQFHGSVGDSPRIFEFRNGPAGLEGTIIGNSGDYSHFSGEATRDSFALSRFDGSFVYLLSGRMIGDTLRGVFFAGLKGQTPFDAVRANGPSPLTQPTEVTRADTTAPFHFAFRDVNGVLVRSDDPQFRGKVLVVDAFGTWCPTCHEAAPALVKLYNTKHAQASRSWDSRTRCPAIRQWTERLCGATVTSSAFRFHCCWRGSTTPTRPPQRCRNWKGSPPSPPPFSSAGMGACDGCTPVSMARYGRAARGAPCRVRK